MSKIEIELHEEPTLVPELVAQNEYDETRLGCLSSTLGAFDSMPGPPREIIIYRRILTFPFCRLIGDYPENQASSSIGFLRGNEWVVCTKHWGRIR